MIKMKNNKYEIKSREMKIKKIELSDGENLSIKRMKISPVEKNIIGKIRKRIRKKNIKFSFIF